MPLAPQTFAIDQDAALAAEAKLLPEVANTNGVVPSSAEQAFEALPAATELAVVASKPKAAAKSAAFQKQLQAKLAEKSIEEVREEIDSMKEKAAAARAAAVTLQEERTHAVLKAKQEYEDVGGEIDTLISKELEVAVACKELRRQKAEAHQRTQQAYANVLGVQKKVAMLEVLAESQRKMADLAEKRKAAVEAAAAAKKDLAEQRQRDKDAFAVAVQSLAKDMGVKTGKGSGRGIKRSAPGVDASTAAQEEAPAAVVPVKLHAEDDAVFAAHVGEKS